MFFYFLLKSKRLKNKIKMSANSTNSALHRNYLLDGVLEQVSALGPNNEVMYFYYMQKKTFLYIMYTCSTILFY